MEVNGQLHAPATLPSGSNSCRVDPKASLNIVAGEEYLRVTHTKNWTLGLPAHGFFCCIIYAILALPCKVFGTGIKFVDLRRRGRNVPIKKLGSSLEPRQVHISKSYAIIDTFSMMTAFVCWCSDHVTAIVIIGFSEGHVSPKRTSACCFHNTMRIPFL